MCALAQVLVDRKVSSAEAAPGHARKREGDFLLLFQNSMPKEVFTVLFEVFDVQMDI